MVQTNKPYSPFELELDFEALESNLGFLLGRCRTDQMFIASVKANAYGLGVVPVACALQKTL